MLNKYEYKYLNAFKSISDVKYTKLDIRIN